MNILLLFHNMFIACKHGVAPRIHSNLQTINSHRKRFDTPITLARNFTSYPKVDHMLCFKHEPTYKNEPQHSLSFEEMIRQSNHQTPGLFFFFKGKEEERKDITYIQLIHNSINRVNTRFPMF